MSLVRAEWSRLVHRRVTLVLAVAMLGVLAIMVLGFGATSKPPTAAELSVAHTELARATQFYDQRRADCLRSAQTAGQRFESQCDIGPRPQLDDFLPYQFSFRRQITGLLNFSALVLGLAGFILGASLVGAEWSSGGMTNLLLWRPRRDAVLAAKLAVVGAGVLTMSVAFLTVWIGAFLLLGTVIGSVGGISADSVASAGLLALRITALTLFLGLAGAALAALGRRTAAAMGAAMAYLLVFEVGTFIVFGLLRSEFSWQLRLSSYATALMIKRLQFTDPSSGHTYTITWVGALVVFTVVAAALVTAAFAVLRRRDVT